MKSGFTWLAAVLDCSGSMAPLRADTIGGFNQFLRDQKAQPGEATLTLARFNTNYFLIHEAEPLRDVAELTEAQFAPSGNTALLDALGKTIDSMGARLGAMKEADRPEKVIVLVITDGEENCSQQYSRSRVAEMVKTQTDVYKWEFVFIGANQDAFLAAQSLNIPIANAMNYTPDSSGTAGAYGAASAGISNRRSGSRGGGFFDPNAKP